MSLMNFVHGGRVRSVEYLQDYCKETDKGRWSNPKHTDSDKCKTTAFELRKFLPNCSRATELECFQNTVAMYSDFRETNSDLENDCYGSIDENGKFEGFSSTSCFRYAVLSLNKWHVLMAYKTDPCDDYAGEKFRESPTEHGKLIEKTYICLARKPCKVVCCGRRENPTVPGGMPAPASRRNMPNTFA
ncbi:hypothetical protein DdX_15867 [Ditylenchus destructor]|uniref:Uncharacterized protein n=1 Tax=Ditylenchus destructor TaxID=166010 RepID=A0AAD4QUD9_9BILA|nr:hypothetical protein DdX_15867 [Ditylenchus destructor]